MTYYETAEDVLDDCFGFECWFCHVERPCQCACQVKEWRDRMALFLEK